MNSNIQKYLSNYADSKLSDLELSSVLNKSFDYVMVIPACAELETFPQAWHSLKLAAAAKSFLCIVVINENDAHDQKIRDNNQQLLLWVETEQNQQEEDSLRSYQLFVIDCTLEEKFSIKEGVGRARKLGCDLALTLINRKIIKEQMIFCSDADVLFPKDYFSRVNFTELITHKISALIYPFNHVLELKNEQNLEGKISKKHKEAIAAYDLSIRLYVLGLNYAQSPYAFSTIGSTLAYSAEAYAQVRGVPKRAAGEDFYMLNKLIAVGPLLRLSGEPLLISGRKSSRTPFGTGPAIQKMLNRSETKADAEVYWPCEHPQLFELLKDFLERLEKYAETFDGKLEKSVQDILDLEIFGIFLEILEDFNWLHKLKKSLQSRRNKVEKLRAAHTFFDALKTLRLLHQFREHFDLQDLKVEEVFSKAVYLSALKKEIQAKTHQEIKVIIESEFEKKICGKIKMTRINLTK